jgi:heme-degrading monooxygenase HmoA
LDVSTATDALVYNGREQDMSALIRQYEGLDAEVRELAMQKANTELRPFLSKAPGFVSYDLFRPDGKDEVITSISFFNSRSEAEASHEVTQEWVETNLPKVAKPHKVAGELVAH